MIPGISGGLCVGAATSLISKIYDGVPDSIAPDKFDAMADVVETLASNARLLSHCKTITIVQKQYQLDTTLKHYLATGNDTGTRLGTDSGMNLFNATRTQVIKFRALLQEAEKGQGLPHHGRLRHQEYPGQGEHQRARLLRVAHPQG